MAFVAATPLPHRARAILKSPSSSVCATAHASSAAEASQPQISPPAPSFAKTFSRRTVVTALVAGSASLLSGVWSTRADEAVQYTVVKKGTGPSPELGDLVGIRFKGSYNGVVFDNLFENPTPYFYRVGSGTVLKGIEEAVLLMKVGDVFDLSLTGDKAFGLKGRRASPGKPTIPPNATVSYTVELSTIPGKEEELLENIDDSKIGDTL